MMILLAVLALAVGVLTPVAAGAGEQGHSVPSDAIEMLQTSKTQVYLVLMADTPIIAYDGDVAGYSATKPVKGKKVNPNSAAVKKYDAYLETNQNAALDTAGAASAEPIYSYTFAVSGFAAELTGTQATALEKQANVISVVPNEIRYTQTDSSPIFLGLEDEGGLWDAGYTGEGVIVGVIDTGIWPEHPSFADDGNYGSAPSDWFGTGCDFGNASFNPADGAFDCNNKLLAAKSYGEAFHGGVGTGLAVGSYNSARDEDGHGSHTTSTAAGNSGVAASIQGSDLGVVSGIAPRSRVSVYKACWSVTAEQGGCATADLAAAIDDAVADGVDVINYSIGSDSTSIGIDDFSFLFADDAGVFVATSAGNDGPGASTVGSPAVTPWVMSVGASTQTRDFRGTVTLGDGTIIEGVTVTGGTNELTLIDSADAGNELCDPAGVFSKDITGMTVLCLRGGFARVAKSQAVANAGGAGMILYNPTLNTLNTDNHYVPSLHVSHIDGPVVKAYIASAGDAATATLSGGAKVNAQGSVMAAFSSRGPNGQSSDLIKPDVTAPGVNILAANTPTALLGSPGESFQAISGTSMSSPHVAGSLALLKQAHPDWTPAMAKSALMTASRQDVVKENGATAADPFDMGAGHIDLGSSSNGSPLDPGLVYDAGFYEYVAYSCGADLGIASAGFCDLLSANGFPMDPSDLNYPSIAVGELVGSQTVVRTVTNVTDSTRTFAVHVQAPSGFKVSVSPTSLKLKSGESTSYYVSIENKRAPIGEWRFGSLTWKSAKFADNGAKHEAYSPIAVRAFEFDAPAEIAQTGVEGSTSFDVNFGYTGDYSASPQGLVSADMQSDNVLDDPAGDIDTALGTCNWDNFPYQCVGITWHAFEVPEGSTYARFSLFDDYTDGADDLDLYVWGPNGFFGGSGSGTSAEEVNAVNPAPGIYEIAVHGWKTDGPDSNYTLFNWGFGPDAGNMTVTGPASASLGGSGTVTVDWTGLTTGTKYLGAVSHSNGTDVIGTTIIGIDTN